MALVEQIFIKWLSSISRFFRSYREVYLFFSKKLNSYPTPGDSTLNSPPCSPEACYNYFLHPQSYVHIVATTKLGYTFLSTCMGALEAVSSPSFGRAPVYVVQALFVQVNERWRKRPCIPTVSESYRIWKGRTPCFPGLLIHVDVLKS